MRLALLTTDTREDRRDYSPELPWFGSAPQALLDGFAAIPEELEVHVVSCAREHLQSPIRLAPNILFHSVYVPSWAWLKTGYLGNILAVRKCLAGIRPDIVHGQGTERDCALSAVCSGYPNIITLHGNMRRLARLAGAKLSSFAGITAILESLAIRFAHGLVCLSEHTRQLVSPIARKTWSIPNAVDSYFFDIQRKKRGEVPIILLVGNVMPNKNQLSFLKAIAPLQADMAFQVKHCGKCDPLEPYAAEVLRFIVQNPWCQSMGFLDREELGLEMTHATMLALPSLEENLPMVILEAMAAGLPVIAANVGGIPDLIVDAETGMLFNPFDAESIRRSVRALLENPSICEQIAARAKDKTLRDHLPKIIARRHLEVYQEILGG